MTVYHNEDRYFAIANHFVCVRLCRHIGYIAAAFCRKKRCNDNRILVETIIGEMC